MNLKRTLIASRARFIISMKMYFRYPLNFILTLFEPLIWLTPFYFMGKSFSSGGTLSGFEKYTGNSDFMGYMVVGYMITIYINTAFWSLGFSLKEEMRQGVLESNWSTPVSRANLLISKSLFQFCAATFEIILTGFICYFAFGFKITPDILKLLGFLIPGIIGILGLGLTISALVLVVKEANAIIDLSSSMVSAISGGFFPIKVLPKMFLFISLSLPLTYINDSTRAIIIGQTPIIPLKYQFMIIISSMVIFSLLGNIVFNKVERKCRSLGILGSH
jgi:ABC-2 type transport system permease protein